MAVSTCYDVQLVKVLELVNLINIDVINYNLPHWRTILPREGIMLYSTELITSF